jgi:hypothetical protein
MKFWQLLSIFRDELNIVEGVFEEHKQVFYLDALKHINYLVKTKKRDVLDSKVDDLLLNEVSKKSKKMVYVSIDGGTIYSYQNIDTNKQLLISEAMELYDHDAIEEVFEKTSSIARQK